MENTPELGNLSRVQNRQEGTLEHLQAVTKSRSDGNLYQSSEGHRMSYLEGLRVSLGKKELVPYIVPYRSSSSKEVRTEKSRQARILELRSEVEAMEGYCLWLARNGISACFLIVFRTTSLGMALPVVSWVYPHQLSTKICTTG